MSKKIQNIHSSLITLFSNEPMLLDQGWMDATLNLFKDFSAADLLALETKRSTPLENTCTATYRDNVAIVPVSGPIMAQAGFLYYMLGIGTLVQDFARDLQAAVNDPNITDILIPFDTPGGSISGVNETGNIIKSLGAIKPITGYVSGSCCSAGYWWGSCCNELVADATARVGSIGVLATIPNTKEASKYETTFVNTSSPNKRPDVSTSKGKSEMLRQVNDLADVFISVVAENMNVSVETVEKDFGAGGVLVGQKALDAGMIHRLGSFEGLIEEKLNPSGSSATNTGTNVRGESVMKLAEMKVKDPEGYKTLMAEAKAEADAEIEAKEKEDKKKKEEEDSKSEEDKKKKKKKEEADTKAIADGAITAENLRLKEINAANEIRLQALEKSGTIRDAKDLQASADTLVSKKLEASTVPERFHGKVKAQIDHNKFVGEDGAMDVKAFDTAVSAEVKDWEDSLGSAGSALQGVSSHGEAGDTSSAEEAEAEALAADLFKYVSEDN